MLFPYQRFQAKDRLFIPYAGIGFTWFIQYLPDSKVLLSNDINGNPAFSNFHVIPSRKLRKDIANHKATVTHWN